MRTRCPHCKHVYDVSKEQIECAYGAVRCGNCMKIFNAINHRLDKIENIDDIFLEKSDSLVSNPMRTFTFKDSLAKKNIFNINLKYFFGIIFVLIFLVALFFGVNFVLQPREVQNFEINDIKLMPGNNLQEFRVEFSLQNLQKHQADIPNLLIEMQDLSQNTIDRHEVLSDELEGDKTPLVKNEKRQYSINLKRPKILVAGVKIFLINKDKGR